MYHSPVHENDGREITAPLLASWWLQEPHHEKHFPENFVRVVQDAAPAHENPDQISNLPKFFRPHLRSESASFLPLASEEKCPSPTQVNHPSKLSHTKPSSTKPCSGTQRSRKNAIFHFPAFPPSHTQTPTSTNEDTDVLIHMNILLLTSKYIRAHTQCQR